MTAAPPVVTSEIGYTGYGGEPLTVTDEAAAALKAGGYVIVAGEDLRAVLDGAASPDSRWQLSLR